MMRTGLTRRTEQQRAGGPPAAMALVCALALLDSPCNAQTAPAADAGFANFAFATELGTGIYTVGGRTIQVYQIPLSFSLRPAKLNEPPPGINFLLPLTVGFFDFPSQPGLHLQIPSHLGAVSLEPGVELDYWLSPQWHLYPYMKIGVTYASSLNALIYGFGVRSDYSFEELGGTGLWRAILGHAGVEYIGSEFPGDSFTRLRNGAELRHDIGVSIKERQVQVAPYGLIDLYFDAPSGPDSGISARTLQAELGLMLGVRPMWKILGVEVPRVGIGYRMAGPVSGWRVVISDPF